jgi:hypothetical protein
MTQELFEKYVANWYEENLIFFYPEIDMLEINYIERDIMKLVFVDTLNDQIPIQHYADPDCEGLHPVRIGSDEYNVVGDILEIVSE